MDPKLGFMSWRLYDMPTSYLNNFAFVGAGTRKMLLPVTARRYSSLGSSIRVKNNFVCLAPSTSILEVAMAIADPGLRLDWDYWVGNSGK